MGKKREHEHRSYGLCPALRSYTAMYTATSAVNTMNSNQDFFFTLNQSSVFVVRKLQTTKSKPLTRHIYLINQLKNTNSFQHENGFPPFQQTRHRPDHYILHTYLTNLPTPPLPYRKQTKNFIGSFLTVPLESPRRTSENNANIIL